MKRRLNPAFHLIVCIWMRVVLRTATSASTARSLAGALPVAAAVRTFHCPTLLPTLKCKGCNKVGDVFQRGVLEKLGAEGSESYGLRQLIGITSERSSVVAHACVLIVSGTVVHTHLKSCVVIRMVERMSQLRGRYTKK